MSSEGSEISLMSSLFSLLDSSKIIFNYGGGFFGLSSFIGNNIGKKNGLVVLGNPIFC